jgi:hypothetical protein
MDGNYVCLHGKDIHAWMKHDWTNNTNPWTDENYRWFCNYNKCRTNEIIWSYNVHDVKKVIPQTEIRPDVKRRCLWSFQDKGCDSTIALESKSQIRSKTSCWFKIGYLWLEEQWVEFCSMEWPPAASLMSFMIKMSR